MADDKPIIKTTTPNSKRYDTKVDVYTSDPRGIMNLFILQEAVMIKVLI